MCSLHKKSLHDFVFDTSLPLVFYERRYTTPFRWSGQIFEQPGTVQKQCCRWSDLLQSFKL